MDALRFKFSCRTSAGIVVYNGNKVEYGAVGADYTSNLYSADYASQGSDKYENLKFYGYAGKKDIYSILFEGGKDGIIGKFNMFNILDFGSFIKQFPNLYSFVIGGYSYQDQQATVTIKGNLAEIPDSVEKVRISGPEINGNIYYQQTNKDLYLNLSSFSPTSKLRWFNVLYSENPNFSMNIKTIGDLSKLPKDVYLFRLYPNYETNIIYTPGRTWAAAFSTLIIMWYAFTPQQIDAILIDLAASVTTAIEEKIINLTGGRTAASDAAVAYLQGLGFTVTIN